MILPRFYPILDTRTLSSRGLDPVATAGVLLDAGAKILQYRNKDDFGRAALAEAEAIADLCHRAHSQFVVNDRADMAMILHAGVHLGQTDLPPERARRLMGDTATIGFSTHNEAQMRDAIEEPVDYLAFGPVFGTASKDNPDPVTGLEKLERVARLTDRPLVAIGGITRANAADVLLAGACSVAVISDLYPEGATAASVRRVAQQWLDITR